MCASSLFMSLPPSGMEPSYVKTGLFARPIWNINQSNVEFIAVVDTRAVAQCTALLAEDQAAWLSGGMDKVAQGAAAMPDGFVERRTDFSGQPGAARQAEFSGGKLRPDAG